MIIIVNNNISNISIYANDTKLVLFNCWRCHWILSDTKWCDGCIILIALAIK